MSRVLICGGRNFTDADYIQTALENLLFNGPTIPSELFIIEGAGPGTLRKPSCDELVYRWRMSHNIPGERYPVDHKLDGPWPAAGPRRNIRMLANGMPDRGIAFPGGKGTAHMTKIMRQYGIPVLELKGRTKQHSVA